MTAIANHPPPGVACGRRVRATSCSGRRFRCGPWTRSHHRHPRPDDQGREGPAARARTPGLAHATGPKSPPRPATPRPRTGYPTTTRSPGPRRTGRCGSPTLPTTTNRPAPRSRGAGSTWARPRPCPCPRGLPETSTPRVEKAQRTWSPRPPTTTPRPDAARPAPARGRRARGRRRPRGQAARARTRRPRPTPLTMRTTAHKVHGPFTLDARPARCSRRPCSRFAAPKHRASAGPARERRPTPERMGPRSCELHRALPGQDGSQLGRPQRHLWSLMALRTLMGGLEPARLDTGSRICWGPARRLACEAGIIPAVLAGSPRSSTWVVRPASTAEAQRIAKTIDARRLRGRRLRRTTRHDPPAPPRTLGRRWPKPTATASMICPPHHSRAHDTRYQMTTTSPTARSPSTAAPRPLVQLDRRAGSEPGPSRRRR